MKSQCRLTWLFASCVFTNFSELYFLGFKELQFSPHFFFELFRRLRVLSVNCCGTVQSEQLGRSWEFKTFPLMERINPLPKVPQIPKLKLRKLWRLLIVFTFRNLCKIPPGAAKVTEFYREIVWLVWLWRGQIFGTRASKPFLILKRVRSMS